MFTNILCNEKCISDLYTLLSNALFIAEIIMIFIKYYLVKFLFLFFRNFLKYHSKFTALL